MLPKKILFSNLDSEILCNLLLYDSSNINVIGNEQVEFTVDAGQMPGLGDGDSVSCHVGGGTC